MASVLGYVERHCLKMREREEEKEGAARDDRSEEGM